MNIKKRFKNYKSIQSVIKELEDTLVLFSDPIDERVQCLYEIIDLEAYAIAAEIMGVEDVVEFCGMHRFDQSFAIDEVFDVMYCGSKSFKKAKDRLFSIKNQVLLAKDAESGRRV